MIDTSSSNAPDKAEERDHIILKGLDDLAKITKEFFGLLGGFALLFWLLEKKTTMDVLFGAMSFILIVSLVIGLTKGVFQSRIKRNQKRSAIDNEIGEDK